MATITGNICLVLASLISWQMITSGLNYKPPHGGSGGAAAYPIWIMLLEIAFLVTLTFATIAIAWKGGFDWISSNKFYRYLLVIVGLLSATFALWISTIVMENPGAEAPWLQVFSRFSLVAVPVILIVSGFILLNDFSRVSVPVFYYKWPLVLVLGLGLWSVVAGIFDWITAPGSYVAKQQQYENSEFIKNNRLREIEEADIQQDMVRVLEFTGIIYPPEVREKAAEKVKSDPEWQQQLLFLLENEQAMAVFHFLASNEVVDKKQFLKPVNTGVLYAAYWVRHTIQGTSPSQMNTDQFSLEVDNVLRTVEKFEGMGFDYLPAVRELRAAFDEPSGRKKFKFDSVSTLDNWITKH